MSVRPTLADLISQVRLLISDPAGASQKFSDLQIQVQLDERRRDARYMELNAAETLVTNGVVKWTHFYSDVSYWEEGVVLQNGSWVNVIPDTADLRTGLWTFTAGTTPPVFAIGNYYDVYGACADLLEIRLASFAEDFDFSTEGTSVRKSVKSTNIASLIKMYRQKQLPIEIGMIRTDMSPQHSTVEERDVIP